MPSTFPRLTARNDNAPAASTVGDVLISWARRTPGRVLLADHAPGAPARAWTCEALRDDAATLAVVDVIDLAGCQASDEPLGWARGIHIDGEGGLWVGFSRIRPTKFRENVAWLARGFKNVRPTRIDRYDLATRQLTHSIDLEPAGLSAVFSVHGAPPAA